MEHLTNCHAEWTTMAALMGYFSFGALWLKLRIQAFKGVKANDRR